MNAWIFEKFMSPFHNNVRNGKQHKAWDQAHVEVLLPLLASMRASAFLSVPLQNKNQ